MNTGEENKLITLKNPEAYYNDSYIKKHIDQFIKDPSSRYDRIEVPTADNEKHYLIFKGRYDNVNAEKSGLVNRYLTWTDLLYIAACEITENKHVMVTRYPILDNFGIFFARIRVASTLKTAAMEINGRIYKWYPVIDLNMSKHEVSNNFIDTTRFSNSYLKGLDKRFVITVETLINSFNCGKLSLCL